MISQQNMTVTLQLLPKPVCKRGGCETRARCLKGIPCVFETYQFAVIHLALNCKSGEMVYMHALTCTDVSVLICIIYTDTCVSIALHTHMHEEHLDFPASD